jgi:arsenite-transporting ATPase
VLRPGGRLAISDVVLARPLPAELTVVMAMWTGCIAGALTEDDCRTKLLDAGFKDVDIEPTNVFGRVELADLAAQLDPDQVPGGLDVDALIDEFDGVIRSAFIRARKPGTATLKETRMPAIHVFEPALCCNTGVCGDDVDQSLVTFTADLAHLRAQGADIERHNLANDPSAFAADETVRAFLQLAGSDGLPLTLVDGITVMTGRYPAREQLLRYSGLADDVVPAGLVPLDMADADAGSCGCGSGGCC